MSSKIQAETLAAVVLVALFFTLPVRGDQPRAATQPSPKPAGAARCVCQKPLAGSPNYARRVAEYKIPDVSLIDSHGKPVRLREQLAHEGPLLLQFAFTSCATICPVQTASTAEVQKKLGDDAGRVRMLTISIDPEHDTPEKLREYAKSLQAQDSWRFLTGDVAVVAAVQKAFDAYTFNKSRHEPLTFLRATAGGPWLRITGLISAADLTGELREMLDGRPQ